MLSRAGSKLALEKLVIKRGAFVDVEAEGGQGLGAQELLDLLKPKEVSGDDPQSGVVDDKVGRCTLPEESITQSKILPMLSVMAALIPNPHIQFSPSL